MNSLAFSGMTLVSPRFLLLASSILTLLLFSGPARAQQVQPSINPPTLEDQFNRAMLLKLMKRVEELESKIKDLEANQRCNPAPSEPVAPTSTDGRLAVRQGPEASSQQPASAQEPASARQPASSQQPASAQQEGPVAAISKEKQQDDMTHEGMPSGSPALRIRGFGDLQYRVSDQKGTTNSFALGQLDLFISSHLSDKLTFLSEIVIEADEHNAFGIDVERLLLQYNASDYFNVAIGRYHTSIGYYNTAYHHGTWFQTAIDRPFLFRFEDQGGILPVHSVGVSITGLVPSGSLGLHYAAEMGNGRASRSPLDEPVQNVVDENNGKAINFALFARPDRAPGLQAGLSVYHDHLTPAGMPNIDETIMAGHLVYKFGSYEFLNEGVLIRHAIQTGHVLSTPGFYIQAARRFGSFWPYFRYEYVNVPAGDPIIGDVGRRNGPSVGLRFNLSEFAALKAEYQRTAQRVADPINGLRVALAFAF